MKIAGILSFVVPLLPPSVNHNKHPNGRGGWYSSRESVAFTDAVCIFSKKTPALGRFYEIEIFFHLPPSKYRLSANDLDNFLKTGIDALGKAGVIKNDGRVLDLHVHKRFTSVESTARTVYTITGKDEEHEDEVFP